MIFLCLPGSAEIYRFVDKKGIIHFTNTPKDHRFKLYIREGKETLGKKNHTLYDQLILKYSRKHQVVFALIKAIIRAESGFDPQAVSRKGAKGLMQLMPETAQRMKVTDAFNPRDNIDGGVRYFKYLLNLFDDDIKLSLAAYNAGENCVVQRGSIPPYPETVNYVKKVLNFYQSYKH